MTSAMWPLAVLLLWLPPDTPPCPAAPRVRAASAMVQSLLDEAARSSGTVRALMERLAHTDAIVYVELTSSPQIAIARTKLVTATRDARFLRVGIKASTPFPELTPVIAHELQHAVEIAERPEIRGDAALKRLYARIGWQAGGDRFETDAAREVERRARVEMRRK